MTLLHADLLSNASSMWARTPGSPPRGFASSFRTRRSIALSLFVNTYAKLVEHMHSDRLTHCHRLALSHTVGESRIFLTANSSTCSLSKPAAYIGEETVVVATVHAFATTQRVNHIDLLKTDAEENDLKGLEGSDDLLVAGSISLIFAEVRFTPGDNLCVLSDSVRDLLAARGFRLFGTYGQQPEWSGEKRLRFANALFCNEVNLRYSRSPLSE
jgi:hypothetical protein